MFWKVRPGRVDGRGAKCLIDATQSAGWVELAHMVDATQLSVHTADATRHAEWGCCSFEVHRLWRVLHLLVLCPPRLQDSFLATFSGQITCREKIRTSKPCRSGRTLVPLFSGSCASLHEPCDEPDEGYDLLQPHRGQLVMTTKSPPRYLQDLMEKVLGLTCEDGPALRKRLEGEASV